MGYVQRTSKDLPEEVISKLSVGACGTPHSKLRLPLSACPHHPVPHGNWLEGQGRPI